MAPLVAFYGDDLTGSTDTLSVISEGGLKTLLFLGPPTSGALAAAGPLDAIGIAGAARTMSPAEMDQQLPVMFDALKATGARLIHYKVCSTFDSSPTVGNIGHAIALARPRFRRGFVPIVVGQPGIGRYCSFGNLFAAVTTGGAIYRLDRHPTMARHPVTPMDEADLRMLLARQGLPRVALLDIRHLRSDRRVAIFADLLREEPDAVLFDVLEESDFAAIGGLIGGQLEAGEPVFGVGSSGLQQALLAGWDRLASTRLATLPPPPEQSPEVVLIVSGSRSPVAAGQIEMAGRAGFALCALQPQCLVDPIAAPPYIAEVAAEVASHIATGRSAVAHTSMGPDDRRRLADGSRQALERLARACGLLAKAVLAQVPLRRLGFAGGDTSTFAARAMGIRALAYEFRSAPGVTVCRVRASGPLDGLQVMLKGGQMGQPDLYSRLAAGQVEEGSA
jgi:uncharacterized protein YgbK (DUF1537 family)